MKYKIGDKVRVRKDLVVDNYYGGVCYVEYMDEFKGKECVITDMDGIAYQIGDFWWTDEMLEPIDEGALLEYALEKLGMTKEELEDEMNEDEEDIEKAKEIVTLSCETDTYCDSFEGCQGCKVQEFRDKYGKFGKMKCYAVFGYLKEKGEI